MSVFLTKGRTQDETIFQKQFFKLGFDSFFSRKIDLQSLPSLHDIDLYAYVCCLHPMVPVSSALAMCISLIDDYIFNTVCKHM